MENEQLHPAWLEWMEAELKRMEECKDGTGTEINNG